MEKLTYKNRLTFGIGDANIIKDQAKTMLKTESKTSEKKLKEFSKKILTKYDNLC